VAALVLIGGGSASLWWSLAWRQQPFSGPVHVVKKERLQFAVVERGTLESADNHEIKVQVKASGRGGTIATTIKWVIEDGTRVRKGDTLVLLDDAGLKDQLTDQRIKVEQARAAWVKADEDYQIVLKSVHIAELNVKKYLGDKLDGKEGEYLQLLNEVEGRIKIAESDLEMWEDRSAWSERMVKRGFLSRSQAEADRARLESAKISLKKVKGELDILERFTRNLTETDLKSKLDEAHSKRKQAYSEKEAKQKILEQEESREAEIEAEIRKCTVLAPQDGLVVYYMPEQSRYGGGSRQSIVAQGEPVNEGQKLMQIPNLTKMQVNVRVHEALVSHIRGDVHKPTGFRADGVQAGLLVAPDFFQRLIGQAAWMIVEGQFRSLELDMLDRGQRAFIRVDAYPNRVLRGHVKTLANVASQAEFFSSDIKVYQTIVSIDEPVEKLKPGMSAEVTILADEGSDEVLTVPIQSVVGTIAMGAGRKCFVLDAKGEPQERDIVIGRSNEKMVEVTKGLSEGDKVVHNPRPLLVGENAKMRPGVEGTRRGAQGEGGGGGEKKGKGRKKSAAPPPGDEPGNEEFRTPAPMPGAGTRPGLPGVRK
jgi:multidrug resistance efflux pump